MPTEPTCTSASTVFPTTVESGTDAEGDITRPELTNSAVEQSSSDSAKTYPNILLEIQLKGMNLPDNLL